MATRKPTRQQKTTPDPRKPGVTIDRDLKVVRIEIPLEMISRERELIGKLLLNKDAEEAEFNNKEDLKLFLKNLAKNHWRESLEGGTGRSGNGVIPVKWKGSAAMLKVSLQADALAGEARHLRKLAEAGAGLSVAKLLRGGEVGVNVDRYTWRAYLVERKGKKSLRDYLFTPAPNVSLFLKNLTEGLGQLYLRNARKTSDKYFVQCYVSDALVAIGKLKQKGSFDHLRQTFTDGLFVKGDRVSGPESRLQRLMRVNESDKSLLALEPQKQWLVHGDLHFENILIDPDQPRLGKYWLIDPKEFHYHDWVYDLAKLLTSLTGHAHVDRGRGDPENKDMEIYWPQRNGDRLAFNCLLNPTQVRAWKAAIQGLGEWAKKMGAKLEENKHVSSPPPWKIRLLLALARHYFSAARYFNKCEAQWVLYARGSQFLELFDSALSGKPETSWDPFVVCQSDSWLETR